MLPAIQADRTVNFVKIAKRTRAISPFRVMKVLQRAGELEAAGRKIVHMEVGEPDFTTAAPIMEAARQALGNGHTHYSNAAGLPALRDAIAGFYQDRYDVIVDASRIFVTAS